MLALSGLECSGSAALQNIKLQLDKQMNYTLESADVLSQISAQPIYASKSAACY